MPSSDLKSLILGVLGSGAVGSLATLIVKQVLERRKESRQRLKQRLELFYEKIRIYLDATRTGFVNQCNVRDRLLQLVRKNHDLLAYKEYEYTELFAALYPLMNEEERTLFGFIRGITENTLFKYNLLMVDLLNKYPHFYDNVPKMKALHEHLDLWLSKYNSTFQERSDMCLVYVGVQDKKPFPQGIEDIIQHEIDAIKGAKIL